MDSAAIAGIWSRLAGWSCRTVDALTDAVPNWNGHGIHRHSVASVVIGLDGLSLVEVGQGGQGDLRLLPAGAMLGIGRWIWHSHHPPRGDGIMLMLASIARRVDVEVWHKDERWFGEVPGLDPALLDGISVATTGRQRMRAAHRLHRALAERAPVESHPAPALQRMSSFIWRMRHARITAAQVLAASGLSPAAAHEQFVRRFEETPKRYLLRTRLDLALHLLAAGRSIGEAWQESGFADRPDFTRCCRRATGLSPRAWVQRRRAAPRGQA